MRPPTDSPAVDRDCDYWAEQRRWVAESRARQGLPPTVRDRDVLRFVAAAVRTATTAAGVRDGS